MKVLIQRVNRASITLRGEASPRNEIGKGLLLLVGFSTGDTENEVDLLVRKVSRIRIFEDENGKTNLSLADVHGEILSISQFTLAGTLYKSGNRPSFTNALEPVEAKRLYEEFNRRLSLETGIDVKDGVFGGDMEIELVNDGPFTMMLDSVEITGGNRQ